MAILWFGVADWLVMTLPQLDGWNTVAVFDGQPVTGDQPTDYAWVGYAGEGEAGNWESLKAESGLSNAETGSVSVTLVCNTGNDPETALGELRARIAGLLEALDVRIRADQTLGGTLAANALVELTSGSVLPVQDAEGSALQVTFSVSYTCFSWRS